MSSTPQQQPTAPAARVGQAVRVAVAVIVVAAGGLFVVGFGLGLLFELDGFGVPGNGPPRPAHVTGYAAGIAAAVAVPVVALRLLFPARMRLRWALVALAVGVLAAIYYLGVGW